MTGNRSFLHRLYGRIFQFSGVAIGKCHNQRNGCRATGLRRQNPLVLRGDLCIPKADRFVCRRRRANIASIDLSCHHRQHELDHSQFSDDGPWSFSGGHHHSDRSTTSWTSGIGADDFGGRPYLRGDIVATTGIFAPKRRLATILRRGDAPVIAAAPNAAILDRLRDRLCLQLFRRCRGLAERDRAGRCDHDQTSCFGKHAFSANARR